MEIRVQRFNILLRFFLKSFVEWNIHIKLKHFQFI